MGTRLPQHLTAQTIEGAIDEIKRRPELSEEDKARGVRSLRRAQTRLANHRHQLEASATDSE